MTGILIAKIKLFLRNPWTFLAMTMMSIGFTVILTGADNGKVSVPIYAADGEIRQTAGKELETSETFQFVWLTEEELMEKIKSGKADTGVILEKAGYKLIVGTASPNIPMIENAIKETYKKQLLYEAIAMKHATLDDKKENIADQFKEALTLPVMEMEKRSFKGNGSVVYNDTFQKLFGFTLFFVIYTIAYNVFQILVERKDGVWDRVILSPVKKWEMYAGNLAYSFIMGYLQVALIFTIFLYWVGVDFKGKFLEVMLLVIPYVFAIVALSILLTAIVRSIQQFNAALPFIAVSMAMIGGAYWPIEVVQSKVMLFLANLMPIKYGMDILKGAIVYDYSFQELLYPMSILIVIGVAAMGIGIHLMEKRYLT